MATHEYVIGGVKFVGTETEEIRLRGLHEAAKSAEKKAAKTEAEAAPAPVTHEAPKAHAAPAHKVGSKKK